MGWWCGQYRGKGRQVEPRKETGRGGVREALMVRTGSSFLLGKALKLLHFAGLFQVTTREELLECKGVLGRILRA